MVHTTAVVSECSMAAVRVHRLAESTASPVAVALGRLMVGYSAANLE
jgi:hypothetical protein